MNQYVGSNVEYLYDNKPQATGWINQGTFIAQLNQRIERGYEYIGVAATTYGSKAITFNAAFGSAPSVVINETTLANAPCRASSVGTGGFTAYVWNGSGGTMSGSSFFNWMAVGA